MSLHGSPTSFGGSMRSRSLAEAEVELGQQRMAAIWMILLLLIHHPFMRGDSGRQKSCISPQRETAGSGNKIHNWGPIQFHEYRFTPTVAVQYWMSLAFFRCELHQIQLPLTIVYIMDLLDSPDCLLLYGFFGILSLQSLVNFWGLQYVISWISSSLTLYGGRGG